MTDPNSATIDLENLLRTGVAVARSGNRAAARELFLAMTRTYPYEVRAWLGLASVAATAAEQREALEHVVAIDPHHLKARQALAQFAPPESLTDIPTPQPDVVSPLLPPPSSIALPPPPETVSADDRLPSAPRRVPPFTRISIALMVILLIAIIALVWRGTMGQAQPATALLPLPSSVLQSLPSPLVTTTTLPEVTQTILPVSTTTLVPSLVLSPPPRQTATLAPTIQPLLAPSASSLPLGTLIEVDGWSVTLLRPDYALVLDGTIGDLQPTGRFVLALMAVSNNRTDARHIPADLFALVDARGRRYYPTPNASTVYLTLYARGQHGDLAFEDSIAGESGMRSVPIIFDVPTDALGLTLTIRDRGSVGWLIEEPVAPANNVGP